MPTERVPLQRPRRGHVGPNVLQELRFGPSPYLGSCFSSRQELHDSWLRARERMLAFMAPGRRPAAFYEFEFDGTRPAYDVERSTLWRKGLLTAEERDALEREWKAEFEKAYAPNFFHHDGSEVLHGDAAVAAHLRWADVPIALIHKWTAARKRRAGKRTGAPLTGGAGALNVNVPEKALDVASGAEGEERKREFDSKSNAAAGTME